MDVCSYCFGVRAACSHCQGPRPNLKVTAPAIQIVPLEEVAAETTDTGIRAFIAVAQAYGVQVYEGCPGFYVAASDAPRLLKLYKLGRALDEALGHDGPQVDRVIRKLVDEGVL